VEVQVNVTLSASDEQQLSTILGCEPAELSTELKTLGAAALTEYLELVLGRRVFTRGSDIREYRLLLLIKHRNRDHLPTEEDISALFQTTTTQSRALLRAVTSKYQYELQDVTNAALKTAVEAMAAGEDGDWHLDASSEFIVEALNRLVGRLDPSLPRLARAEGTLSRYVVKTSTRNRLRGALGLQ
jgi:hypothetical protein